MEIEEAIEIVEEHLSEEAAEINDFGSALPGYVNRNVKLQILPEFTEEHDFGWVFYYDTTKYIERGDSSECLVGNAPLIVNRESGQLIATGTARETSYYVNNYIKTGDPHNEDK